MWEFNLGSIKLLSIISSGLIFVMGLVQIIVSSARWHWFSRIEPLIQISFKEEALWVLVLGVILVLLCIFGLFSISWASYGMLLIYSFLLLCLAITYFIFGCILVKKSNDEELSLNRLYKFRYEMIKYRRPHPLYILQRKIGCCGIDDFSDLFLLEWYYWNFFQYVSGAPKNYTGPFDESGPKDEGLEDIGDREIYPREYLAETISLQPQVIRKVRNATMPYRKQNTNPSGPYWQAFKKVRDNELYDEVITLDRKKRSATAELKLPLLRQGPKNEKEFSKLTKYLDTAVANYAKKKAAHLFPGSWMDPIRSDNIPGYINATGNKFKSDSNVPGWPVFTLGYDWYIPHLHFWLWLSDSELALYPTTIKDDFVQVFDFSLVQTCCKNPSKNCTRTHQTGEIYENGCGRVVVAEWRKVCAELGAILITYTFMMLIAFVHVLLYTAGVQEVLYF